MEEKYFEYPIYELPDGRKKKKFCHAVFKNDDIYLVRKDGGKTTEIPYEYAEGQLKNAKISYRNYREKHHD